ncbi:MAG: SDR family NAD(P)-dependent oxidoreductase [Capsulimonadaceae bacterium]|nr:SDR family NAD(P)-dependent oxidoreductase [Capsulimonadaceae bacterium]
MALIKGKKRYWLAGAAAAAAIRYAIRRRRIYDLYGKVVLVTGSSHGLGLLLAREFANRGAKIVLCDNRPDDVERARIDMVKRGATVLAHVCDVTRLEDVKNLISVVRKHFGDVDVLVNNAGAVQSGPMQDMRIEDYEDAMRVHFWAPLYATLEVLPSMRTRKQGRIVNISSLSGKVSVPYLLPYSASKFALVGLSEGLRTELVADNVFVTTVCPGLIRPGMSATGEDEKTSEEDEWLALSESFPLAATSADSAARKIVEATIHGDAEIVLSVPARIATIARALFPEPVSDTMALVNQALPTTSSACEQPDEEPLADASSARSLQR